MKIIDYKQMCIKQGYVPPTCKMDGQMCWLLVQADKDPCDGCNWNRAECNGRQHKKYDSEGYRIGTCIDNYIERIRQEEYNLKLKEQHKKNRRSEKHAECNAKVILSIITDIGRRGRPEIELKVNDLINEYGYVRTYENPDEAILCIPAIIKKYGVGQIQCEINGFGLGVYNGLKDARLGVDIVPLTYRRLTY